MAAAAPAAAPTLKMGDKVLVNQKAIGHIAYLGNVEFAPGQWVGVVLNRPTGLIDGCVMNKSTGKKRKYFDCKPNFGLFVRPRSVALYNEKTAAAARIQAAARGRMSRARLDDELSFQAFTGLDEDLERLGLERAHKLVQEGHLDEREDAALLDIKDILAIPEDRSSESKENHIEFTSDGRLDKDNVMKLMEMFKSKDKLHERDTLLLLHYFYKRELTISNTVNNVTIEPKTMLTVVGDLHGQWEDLMTIFNMNGLPSDQNRYLFNGDIVDRGANSVEILLLLLAFRLWNSEAVNINRGNHECYPQNFQYGFADEVLTKFNPKYREKVFWSMQRCFKALPLCRTLNKRVFVVHGGLFRNRGVTLDQIRGIERQRDIPPLGRTANRFQDNMFEDLMWSDPRRAPGFRNSSRGAGVLWGPDLTKDFLKRNHLGLVVRSHEPPERGHQFWHDRRVVTIFSASLYQGQNNRGAFMKFESNLHYAIHSFVASRASGPEIHIAMQRAMARAVTTQMIVETVCAHKAELYSAFEGLDTANSGMVSKDAWAFAMAQVTQLDLPWLWVCNNMCDFVDKPRTLVDYLKFLDRYTLAMKSGWQNMMINRICRSLYVRCADVKQAYKWFDIDSNGKVGYQEFIEGIKRLNVGLTDGQIFELLRDVDADKNGYIDMAEFGERFGVQSSFFVDGDDAINERIRLVGKAFFSSGRTAEEVFAAFDDNTDNTISQDEFLLGVKGLGVEMADDAIIGVFKAVDVDSSGRIDPLEFTDAFYVTYKKDADAAKAAAETKTDDPLAVSAKDSTWAMKVVEKVMVRLFECRSSVQALCHLFDTDGDGLITHDEFKTGLRTLGLLGTSGDELTDEEVDAVLECMDTNHDGNVSYEEFSEAFKVRDELTGSSATPTPMRLLEPVGSGGGLTGAAAASKKPVGGDGAAAGGAGGGAGAGAGAGSPSAGGSAKAGTTSPKSVVAATGSAAAAAT